MCATALAGAGLLLLGASGARSKPDGSPPPESMNTPADHENGRARAPSIKPGGYFQGSLHGAPLDQLLAARHKIRMYDGAPPVIPHPVAELGRENCAACHTPGAYWNGARVATPRSHPAWGDCRQCHLERRTTKEFRKTTFTPLRYPAHGHRQTPAAPPMIPHLTQNRTNCVVCHIGKQAAAALRSSHGYRPECRQCHLAAQH